MTPAIKKAKQAKIKFKIHEYEHDQNYPSYGEEAAKKLKISPNQVFKTLVVQLDHRELEVAVVPVSKQLDLKLFSQSLAAKKSKMANKGDVERVTGYVLGGVSPLGQKKNLITVIDQSALEYETIFVSAGKRGLEIELSPKDLTQLSDGKTALISKFKD